MGMSQQRDARANGCQSNGMSKQRDFKAKGDVIALRCHSNEMSKQKAVKAMGCRSKGMSIVEPPFGLRLLLPFWCRRGGGIGARLVRGKGK